MQPYHPRVPWIHFDRLSRGGYLVVDSRTGERAFAPDERALAEFAARRSAAPGYRGLGDALRSVTEKMGFGSCAPCARRQAQLNGLVPRLFRR